MSARRALEQCRSIGIDQREPELAHVHLPGVALTGAILGVFELAQERTQEGIAHAKVELVSKVDVAEVGGEPVVFAIESDLVRLGTRGEVTVANALPRCGKKLVCPALEQMVRPERRLESIQAAIAAQPLLVQAQEDVLVLSADSHMIVASVDARIASRIGVLLRVLGGVQKAPRFAQWISTIGAR